MRRGLKWLLLFAALLFVVVSIGDINPMIWVGSADLEMEFVVTDGVTGTPLQGAQIEADYPEGGGEAFTLTTDTFGSATIKFANCTTAGKYSYFGLIDTWSLHLPGFRFRAAAETASPGDWQYVQSYQSKVERIGPRQAWLVVPITVSRSQ